MNEFDLIDLIIKEIRDLSGNDCVVLGPGDDAAVVRVPLDHEMVVTTDVLIGGVHFPNDTRGDLVGYRAVAVNMSDLAAMGSVPKFLTVALTIAEGDIDWIKAFAHGIVTCASECGAAIVGGNLARGPLSVAVTAHGLIPQGQSLLRTGAVPSNRIWVTGRLGVTSAFLQATDVELPGVLPVLLTRREESALARYFLPPNRCAFANRLLGVATSAIDISDGLIADLSHITDASGCGALINAAKVPLWPSVDLHTALGPDDSYELLFTADADDERKIVRLAKETDTPVSQIGTIVKDPGIREVSEPKRELPNGGYSHF